MPRVANQGALQAAALLQKARESEREIRVSSTGNLRVISSLETKLLQAFPKLRDWLANGRPSAEWEKKAKDSIHLKLLDEAKLFKKTLSEKEKEAIGKVFENICIPQEKKATLYIKKSFDKAVNSLNVNENSEFSALARALHQVEELNEEVDPHTLNLLKKELQHNGGDLRTAKNVTTCAEHLINKKRLNEGEALDVARGICQAMDLYQLNFKEAYDLAQFAKKIALENKVAKGKGLIEFAYYVQIEMHSQKIPRSESVAIVTSRMNDLSKLAAALPPDMKMAKDGKALTLSKTLSKQTEKKIIEELKELALIPQQVMENQFDKDADRDVFLFRTIQSGTNEKKTAPPSLLPRGFNKVRQDLKIFSETEKVSRALVRLMNQKNIIGFLDVVSNELLTATRYPPFMASDDNAELNRTRKSACIYDAFDYAGDEIFLEYTYIQKFHFVQDAQSNKLPVNQGGTWDGDVNETNYSQRTHLVLKILRSDIERDIFDPVIIETAEVQLRVEPVANANANVKL